MSDASSIESWPVWEEQFSEFLQQQLEETDAAHDRAHVERVVTTARRLAQRENAELAVVIPAAWLHDCVVIPKDDPRRAEASQRAADTAAAFLRKIGYPSRWIDPVSHAIEAHSYSAEITPETPEAKVVQDADRLDALGAVGLARCFMVGGQLGHALYHPGDPFCNDRPPDDNTYSIDHFYTKLLRLPNSMQTDAGQEEAKRRASFLRSYLDQLAGEIGVDDPT